MTSSKTLGKIDMNRYLKIDGNNPLNGLMDMSEQRLIHMKEPINPTNALTRRQFESSMFSCLDSIKEERQIIDPIVNRMNILMQ